MVLVNRSCAARKGLFFFNFAQVLLPPRPYQVWLVDYQHDSWIAKTFTFNFESSFTLFKKDFLKFSDAGSGFMTIANVCCHLFVLVSLFSATGLLEHKLPHIAQTLKIKIGSVVKQKLLQEHLATRVSGFFLSRGFIFF